MPSNKSSEFNLDQRDKGIISDDLKKSKERIKSLEDYREKQRKSQNKEELKAVDQALKRIREEQKKLNKELYDARIKEAREVADIEKSIQDQIAAERDK